MKKAYETPSVEMIAFRYRDQVVAASGISGQNIPSRSGDTCEFFRDLNEFADSWGDGRVCNWNAFG